jgi:UPF0755 protein
MMTDSRHDHQTSPDAEESVSAERRDKARMKVVAVGFFLFFIVLAILVHWFANALASTGNSEPGEHQFRIIEIPAGSTLDEIARKLAEERIISSMVGFKVAAAIRRSTRALKAGEYMFDTSEPLYRILRQLEQGRIMLHRVTIPEGYTVRHIAERLHQADLVDSEEFIALAENREFCRELGIESHTLEGFLFPDTYKMAKGLPTQTVLRIMVDRFLSVWATEMMNQNPGDGTNLWDIVVIASIIEKEAIFDDEKPLIASVIYNRLARGMPLQCDVTIRYPLDNYGVHLTYADLKMDSPYNSYLHLGLPPTPICNPGDAAIRAALNPPQTDYFYFVSMNNGRHKFSKSLQEHNKAVYKYQVLNERG